MGASSFLGLLAEINVDPSKAEAAMDRFAAQSGKTMGYVQAQVRDYNAAESAAYDEAVLRARGFGEQVDKSLLSNTQSVRLASSEIGVGLPRAVSSALAQMLPDIATMGTALLGVFAVEEVFKFAKAASDALRELQGDTKDLRTYWDDIVADQEKILRAPRTIAEAQKDLDESARRLGEINKRVAVLQKQLVQDIPDASAKAATAAAGAWGAPMMAAAAATSATRVRISKELNDLQAESEKLETRQAAQINELNQLQNEAHKEEQHRMHEAATAAKHAAEEANRRAHQDAEFIIRITEEGDRSTKRMQKWHEEWLKSIGMPEEVKFSLEEVNRRINQNGLAAAMALPSIAALGGGFRQLTEAERALLPLGNQIDDQLLRQAQRIHEIVMEMQTEEVPARRRIQLEYQRQIDAANREIAHERYEYQQHKITRAQMEADEQAYTQMVLDLESQREEAAKRERAAQAESLAQSVAGLLGRLGLRKAEAVVEASVEVAKGYACLGARDFWEAAQHFISATEWGVVAGQATHHGAGGGGGSDARGAGYGASYAGGYEGGGGGYGERAASGTGLAPGAQPGLGSRTLNVIIMGESQQARFFAEGVNRADKAGHFMQVAASRRGAPAQG